MSSTYNPGRVAGFLYLLLVLAGPVRLIYILSKHMATSGDRSAKSEATPSIWLGRQCAT
jgi:hypothetical protein